MFLRAALVALALAPLARADIPPPGGEKCTVARATDATDTCETCGGYHAEPERCDSMAAKGLVLRCKSSGATVWTEIWCKPKTEAFGAAKEEPTSPPPTPQPATRIVESPANQAVPATPLPPKRATDGCQTTSFAPALALVAAALAARRRR